MDSHVVELMMQLCFVDRFQLLIKVTAGRLLVNRLFLSRNCFDSLESGFKNVSENEGLNNYCGPTSIGLAGHFLLEYPTCDADDIYCSAITLKVFSDRASQIHDSIVSAVWSLAKDRGCVDEISRRIDSLDLLFKQPDSVPRPYHLHHSTNSAGGGDFERMSKLLNTQTGNDFAVPETWMTSIQMDHHENETTLNSTYVLKMLDNGEIKEACYQSMRNAKIIRAVGIETYDLFLEMTMWRRLPCAMALHSRLGSDSCLRLLGQDVLLMVSYFVTN